MPAGSRFRSWRSWASETTSTSTSAKSQWNTRPWSGSSLPCGRSTARNGSPGVSGCGGEGGIFHARPGETGDWRNTAPVPLAAGGARGPVWHGHHGDAGKVRPQHRLPRPGQLPLLPGLPVLHRGGARVHRLRHRHGRRLQEGLHPGAGRGRDDIEGCRQVGGADSRLATEGSPPGSVVPLRLHLLHLAVPQPRPLGLRPRSPAGEALQRRSAGASPAGHHRGDAQRLETLRQQHQLPQRALRHKPRVPPAPSLLHFWKRNFSHSTLGAGGGRVFLPDFEPQGPLCVR
ncbi:pyroglutamyl-peptidase 1 isoform X1 [Podarcis muralis]